MINPFAKLSSKLTRAWRKAELRDPVFIKVQLAIKSGNAIRLEKLLEGTSFNKRQQSYLLSDAIESNNVAIFNQILGLSHLHGNVNLKLTSSTGEGGGGGRTKMEKTLLFKALESGAADIALSLALNPETRIDISGSETYISKGRKHTAQYASPLEYSRLRGRMGAVHAALLARTNTAPNAVVGLVLKPQ